MGLTEKGNCRFCDILWLAGKAQMLMEAQECECCCGW